LTILTVCVLAKFYFLFLKFNPHSDEIIPVFFNIFGYQNVIF